VVLVAAAAIALGLGPLAVGPVQAQAQAANDAAKGASESTGPTVAGKAIDAVKSVANGAGNIFGRVPCATPKTVKYEASVPHTARKLASDGHITIVAFGSSSTSSYGASSPAFQYPNRLAEQLRRHYPHAGITVINEGVGGEDVPEEMKRLKSSVIDLKPDLVIWQLGTNAVIRGGDLDATMGLIEDGIRQMQAIGTDVVLVDPQYVPATEAHEADTDKMVSIIGRAARAMKVGVFPRFKVMKEWHTAQSLPFDVFVIRDGLHMNDWGYACFAQLLGDTIIRSVDQVKAGLEASSSLARAQPM
jgi:lysophospholipase L1-like esterase